MYLTLCVTKKINLNSFRKLIKVNVDHGKIINISDTQFVRNLRNNFLSVSKITIYGYEVLFTKENAFIIDQQCDSKMIVEKQNGLYFIREADRQSCIFVKDSLKLWHRRFGEGKVGEPKKLNVARQIDGNDPRENTSMVSLLNSQVT